MGLDCLTGFNQMSVRASGKSALFTEPETKIGGERHSYNVPTYEAMKGVFKNIFWKPTIVWYIDAIRIMKEIKYQSMSFSRVKYAKNQGDLSIYDMLVDVEYQILGHFEWNMNRPELVNDRNAKKFYAMSQRFLTRGSRCPTYFGISECKTDEVGPCDFMSGEGFYDHSGVIDLGVMFHSFVYPDEAVRPEDHGYLTANFAHLTMCNGVIEFPRPEDCVMTKRIHPMEMKSFGLSKNQRSIDALASES